MSALVELRGPAAAMLSPNINTDIIAPLVRAPDGMQPAGIRSDAELAQRLFGPWRYDGTGADQPEFVLNQAPFRQARFLLAGPNFACGSSRETAATMLKAFGIRCVIAPSFGQIFQDNCFRNHMLALVLDFETVQHLGALAASGADFLLDVERSALVAPDGSEYLFALPSFRQTMLLRGEDEVAVTLRRADQISVFQQSAKARRPWEWPAVVR
ncbi:MULTISPECIES: 3-isopropylmalate dehydratase small subunit [unclassified Variovorax]|uniref:3-isopropylmalate dehydratase small subunit n=1 Tax=unclassified Variovorax TaxID=663243 RepID=UPI00076DEE18|nr:MULTISPECIES: 3-isopropylmalate dehydratase small subunit [unclassified Variovorax]KWT98739.1 3-isopropylmalate dehydratase small subunit [Variovorax sp. WDL1]PNG56199.1 3-isopropylmalate dehydratase small subunit 1 [Variovorax sp. B4]PNG57623.1 3-isopropylmalate dehydratase small subunit 1 [Variovorax sp. B2]VTV09960.1 3-isopropylmalate dehydratase small subunit [Variovorax sp. WDL1]